MRRAAVVGTVISCLFVPGLFSSGQAVAKQNIDRVSYLHRFAGGPDEGSGPQGGLAFDGTTFYGTTAHHECFGNCNDDPTDNDSIYSVNLDGTGFTQLHDFVGAIGDGEFPLARPTLIGSTMYGTTWKGGAHDVGSIYSMNTDGSNFTILHDFNGIGGRLPRGNLTAIGSTLYGTAGAGGDGMGVIFSVNTDGSSFSLLHEFMGGSGDGTFPFGGLLLDGSTFYGTTSTGGLNNSGTVFSIETDGSDFAVLHEFNVADGSQLRTNVTLDGTTLYSVANTGGTNGHGTVFSLETDGSDFEVLHHFKGEPIGGSLPVGELIVNDSYLYGTTRRGGDTGHGTLYSLGTDGSDFSLLHEFRGTGNGSPQNGLKDGSQPQANMLLIGSSLYMATARGGDDNFGTVLSFDLTPDFDDDGNIDGRDFLAWQRGDSITPLRQGDLASWQADFGGFASPPPRFGHGSRAIGLGLAALWDGGSALPSQCEGILAGVFLGAVLPDDFAIEGACCWEVESLLKRAKFRHYLSAGKHQAGWVSGEFLWVN